MMWLVALALVVTAAGLALFAIAQVHGEPFECPHPDDPLCKRYGCLDDPNWRGDRH